MLVCVAGGEFRVKAGAKSGEAGALGLLVEGPLDSQIRVSHTLGGSISSGALDGQVGGIQIQFQVVGQAVVELEVGGVLTDVGVLKLEGVVLIEELEVPFSAICDAGVICVEGELGAQGRAEAEQTSQRQTEPDAMSERH